MQSILYGSTARVVVGYVDEEDIADITHHERVEFVDLSRHVAESRRADTHGEYRDYGTGAFSTAVVLKWKLFEHCLTQGDAEVVIYCDIDVVWLEDVAHDLAAAFRAAPAAQMLVQSQQINAAVQLPCMGFVALRGSARALEIVRECGRRNQQKLLAAAPDEHVSDERILQEFIPEAGPGEIQNLPQAAYPNGALANLYRRDPLMPGVTAPRPLIFHANFVIGVDAKIELLTRVLRELGRLDPHFGLADD